MIIICSQCAVFTEQCLSSTVSWLIWGFLLSLPYLQEEHRKTWNSIRYVPVMHIKPCPSSSNPTAEFLSVSQIFCCYKLNKWDMKFVILLYLLSLLTLFPANSFCFIFFLKWKILLYNAWKWTSKRCRAFIYYANILLFKSSKACYEWTEDGADDYSNM